MIPASFEYTRAKSVGEAIKMLSDNGAQALAGGHSLIPAMKLRLNQPDQLVDIGRIPELKFIRREGDKLVIGAATTHHEIASSEEVQNAIPMLAQGANHIGDPAVRNKGTIGGSLAHADPAADWPAMMLAVDARIEIANDKGKYTVSAQDFFVGFYMTALQEGELLVAIHIPVPVGDYRSHYAKFVQPASRFAIVGCAAVAKMTYGNFAEVKVAFTGVADTAFRDTVLEEALFGQPATEETIDKAVEKAVSGASDLLEDHYASVEYRRHLAKVYAKRALMELI